MEAWKSCRSGLTAAIPDYYVLDHHETERHSNLKVPASKNFPISLVYQIPAVTRKEISSHFQNILNIIGR